MIMIIIIILRLLNGWNGNIQSVSFFLLAHSLTVLGQWVFLF